MRCAELLKGLDPPPEGGQVSELSCSLSVSGLVSKLAMNAISPRLVTRLRSRGSRNRWWRRALF